MANEAEKARSGSSSENVDRFSDLPDSIIHKILCLVDLKCAVQTCVLSKRWRFLWTSLTELNFNGTCMDFMNFLTFNRFVSRVLATRDDSNLYRVQLYSTWSPHHSLLDMVIKYAVSHHIQNMVINYGHSAIRSFSLPPAFLTCQSLKTLQLSGFNLKAFGVALPNLISLSLSHCSFTYPSDIDDPFASCLNLKNLSLRFCSFLSSKVLKISGFQLLDLEILGLGYMNLAGLLSRIEIFAPKLVSFIYKLSYVVDFSGLHLPSLNYAHIHVCAKQDKKREAYLDAINLFKGLGNAQSVKLHSETIEVLGSFPGLLELEPSPFKRLKSLKVAPHGKSLVPPHVMTYLLGGTSHANYL
ncbi:unnamed protein product [Dovyalis caffra]|uniref:F-box domain-containing protein n=1 Tax=Dovyalis caffra TaxID=77055 RepID=A0AAV1QWD0_9ROSI|nr:unnamed protein product [Dovyalis caffra]